MGKNGKDNWDFGSYDPSGDWGRGKGNGEFKPARGCGKDAAVFLLIFLGGLAGALNWIGDRVFG